MKDTITLPRSGVVLTRLPLLTGGKKSCRGFGWLGAVGGAFRLKDRESWADGPPEIQAIAHATSDVAHELVELRLVNARDFEQAADWLDRHLLALRAALLPADARERVARELAKFNALPFDDTYRDNFLLGADAILAALGGAGGA